MRPTKINAIWETLSLWEQSTLANFIWVDLLVLIFGFALFFVYLYLKVVLKTLLKYSNVFVNTGEAFTFFKAVHRNVKVSLINAILNTVLLTNLFSILSCSIAIKKSLILKTECGSSEVLLPTRALAFFSSNILITDSFLFYKGVMSLLFLTFLIVNKKYLLEANKVTSVSIIFMVINFYALVFIPAANSMVAFMILVEIYTLTFFYILVTSTLSSRKFMVSYWVRLEALTSLVYFLLMSTIGSALLYFGFSQIYFWRGSVFLSTAFNGTVLSVSENPLPQGISWLLILGGILAKIGLFPYHSPSLRVVIFTPTPFFFYNQIFPKLAFFFTAVSLSKNYGLGVNEVLMYGIGIASLIVGTHIMFTNNHLKKFVFGSSLSTSGALMFSLAYTDMVFDMFLPYWIIYGSSLLILNVSATMFHKTFPHNIYITSVISSSTPTLRAILLVNFASLAGLAPFSGFFLKAYFIKGLIFNGAVGPAIILALLLVINSIGYLKVILHSRRTDTVSMRSRSLEFAPWVFIVLNFTIAVTYLAWF